jgi:hypothetical protein
LESRVIFAYLDPAFGGMVIQMLVAAAVAIPFFLRAQIARTMGRLRGRRAGTHDEGPSDPAH